MQHWWDNFVSWSGGDWAHWVGGVSLVAAGWVARNFPIHSGIVGLTERFNAFEQRYERDEEQRLSRYREATAAQERLSVELADYRECMDAKLAIILDRLGVPADTHLHRRETDV